MPEKLALQSRTDEFARRAAQRLAAEGPTADRVARFDPAWIALFIAVVRLLIVLLGPGAAPSEIARLRAPRWWQVVAFCRRRRLLAEARRHVEELDETALHLARAIHDNPDALAGASVDAALDEAASSSAEDLRAIAQETQP